MARRIANSGVPVGSPLKPKTKGYARTKTDSNRLPGVGNEPAEIYPKETIGCSWGHSNSLPRENQQTYSNHPPPSVIFNGEKHVGTKNLLHSSSCTLSVYQQNTKPQTNDRQLCVVGHKVVEPHLHPCCVIKHYLVSNVFCMKQAR